MYIISGIPTGVRVFLQVPTIEYEGKNIYTRIYFVCFLFLLK